MALNSFADVQNFFKGINVAGAPHGAFWNTLSYSNFVGGNVPGVTTTDPNDPNKQIPIPILIKGNGAQSTSKRWPGPGCLTRSRGASRGCRGKDLISPTLRFRNSRPGSPAPRAAPNSGS